MASTAGRRYLSPVDEREYELLPDLPSGPLDVYRSKASFCWKKMRLYVEDEDLLKFKMRVWKTMEADPLFQQSHHTPSISEIRKIAIQRYSRIVDYHFFNRDDILKDPRKYVVLLGALNMYEPTLMVKYVLPMQFFVQSVIGMGTEKQIQFVEQQEGRKITGCFAMTEIAHGTNTKKLQTTATYDPRTKEFILNSPTFESAKCWVGCLGQIATHATVFAQLITQDGENKGLHAFVTPIRDPKTMLPFAGIVVGDMGEKIGLNGVDNGFLMFSNYRIPQDNLLDRTGTVTSDGEYLTPFSDPNKRFGASLASLMGGRMAITSVAVNNLQKAMVIALRYSGVRRQFGPTEVEVPVLEYQLQQWRLIPYLATTYVLSDLAALALKEYMHFYVDIQQGGDAMSMGTFITEFHALMSGAKPLCSWMSQHGIQDCREACGGHGYLKASGFGTLRNDNDANCTYEGDNNVLMQQTSNWLLSLWGRKARNEAGKLAAPFQGPLGSVDFLQDIEAATSTRFTAQRVEDLLHPSVVLSTYAWLLCYLLETTQQLFAANMKLGKGSFTARNDAQVYHARTLTIAYTENMSIQYFWRRLNSQAAPELRPVLTKLCTLYGLWSLEKHIAYLYEGGFANGPSASRLIRKAILHLCADLKPDAVSLADALAPPDFILNSPLGQADGEVYKALQSTFYQGPGVFERPSWWQEMTPRTVAKL